MIFNHTENCNIFIVCNLFIFSKFREYAHWKMVTDALTAMDQLYAQLVYIFTSAGVVITSMLLLTLGVYLNSISVGANVIPIHGRYFVAFLPVFLCGVLTPFLADRLWVRFPRLAGSRLSGAVNCISILLLAGMVASFATICLTIIDRYYLR